MVLRSETEGSTLAYQDSTSSHPASSAPGIGHNGRPPLSNDEAARYIRFSPSWMRQSRMPGKTGPPYHRIGRSIRYYPDDLDDWLAQHRCVPGAEQGGAEQGNTAVAEPARAPASSAQPRRGRPRTKNLKPVAAPARRARPRKTSAAR
jgi:hypothetical protein